MLVLSLGGLATGADARRGGSFGSRGSRTYSAPRQTYGSGYASPIRRSTTPDYGTRYGQDRQYDRSSSRPYYPGRRRFGFGGGLIGGLVAGGLIGHFLGHGGGFLAGLLQLLVLGGIAWFVVSLLRGRRSGLSGFGGFSGGAGNPALSRTWSGTGARGASVNIQPTDHDRQTFERILIDVQDAYSREDRTRLRALCTPEIVSYFAEEIDANAARGVRNDVSGVRLISAETSEAWSENGVDYATVALRYESADVTRDRRTGAVVEGSTTPDQTIEYWTYRRDATGGWKLSAIQES
jgi:predicted lipid-binding transport protein (Tim44 family)